VHVTLDMVLCNSDEKFECARCHDTHSMHSELGLPCAWFRKCMPTKGRAQCTLSRRDLTALITHADGTKWWYLTHNAVAGERVSTCALRGGGREGGGGGGQRIEH
jgi:hypothetical protein